MTSPARPLAVVLAAAALLGACGDDDEDPTTVTVTETQTVDEPETTREGDATDEPSKREGEPPAVDLEVDELTGFSSPTGNIGCYISPETVRCDISERDWSPPPAPPSCELDFGQGIELPAGGFPRFVCAGDTALGPDRKLAYDSSIGAGLLRCESRESGIRCQETENGSGFLISRERYELF
jgi:hypothetical protein